MEKDTTQGLTANNKPPHYQHLPPHPQTQQYKVIKDTVSSMLLNHKIL